MSSKVPLQLTYLLSLITGMLLLTCQGAQALPITCYAYKPTVNQPLKMIFSEHRFAVQQLCLIETSSSQLVLDSWVGVGSANETPDVQGISHFLEHLLFKGSKGYPVGALDQFFETQGGITNAATSYDFTHYFQVLPSFDWLPSLKAHQALMATPVFPQHEVDLERAVVVQEMSRAYNSQFAQLFNGFHRLFLAKTPYEHPVLGTPTIIQTTPINAIQGYYQRYYQPNNRVLFIASNLPKETIVNTLQLGKPLELTSPSSSKPAVKTLGFKASTPVDALVVEHADAVKHPLYMVGIPLDRAKTPLQQLAMGLAWQLLFSEEADFFQQHLQPIDGLDTYFSGLHELKNAPYGYWGSTLPDVSNISTVLEQWQALSTTLQTPQGIDALFTDSLFQQQKRKLQKQWQLLAEAPQEATAFYGEAWTAGQWELARNYGALLNQLSLADVKQAVQSIAFAQAKSLVLLPAADKTPTTASVDAIKQWQYLLTQPKKTPNKTQSVSPVSVAPNPFSALKREPLKGIAGATLVSQPDPKSPTVALLIALHYTPTTVEQKAVRFLLSKLIGLETQGVTEQAWLQWLTSRGIEATVTTDTDSVNFYCKGLAENEADVRQAMTGLFQPQWDATLFDRECVKLLQALESLPQHPQSYLQAILAEQAFGDRAYRTNREALMKAVKSTTLLQVQALWHQLQQQAPITIVEAGHYTPDWLATTVKSWFNPEGKRTIVATEGVNKGVPLSVSPQGLPKVASPEKTVAVAGQKTVWLGWAWALPPANQSNVLMPFRVLNAYLGQGMSAVLFQEVREKQGLAYEVASKVDLAEKGAMFTLYLGTAPEKVAQAKSIVMGILQKLAKEPLSDVALAEAKQKVKGRFGMSHSTASDRATLLLRFETLGLGALFDEQYIKQVEAVTAQQLQQMVQTYLKLELGTVVELKAPPVK